MKQPVFPAACTRTRKPASTAPTSNEYIPEGNFTFQCSDSAGFLLVLFIDDPDHPNRPHLTLSLSLTVPDQPTAHLLPSSGLAQPADLPPHAMASALCEATPSNRRLLRYKEHSSHTCPATGRSAVPGKNAKLLKEFLCDLRALRGEKVFKLWQFQILSNLM